MMNWERYRLLALSLDLPRVEEATSWGNPCLKAHVKLWAWWSPQEDAPVFKVEKEEREMMIEAEPDRFFVTPHYEPHKLILMRKEAFDEEWAKHQLMKTWGAMAPKRFPKQWDEKH
ncbi:MAG: MmcQ/YjbR family DNA-binding protein [Pseudomonadota bacterium]